MGCARFELASQRGIRCIRAMRLNKTGKLIAIGLTLLLSCAYLAYRNSAQRGLAPTSQQRIERAASRDLSEQNPTGKNEKRTELSGSKIDAILLHKDISEINPSDIDRLFDDENVPSLETQPPE